MITFKYLISIFLRNRGLPYASSAAQRDKTITARHCSVSRRFFPLRNVTDYRVIAHSSCLKLAVSLRENIENRFFHRSLVHF